MMTREEFVSCSSMTTTSGGRITDKALHRITPFYLASAIIAEKAISRYYSMKVCKVLQLISELGRNWNRRFKEMEGMVLGGEDGTMLVASNSFIECKMYTHYMSSLGSVDQCLRSIMRYEACRHAWSAVFSRRESMLQVFNTTWNSRMTKGRMKQTLTDCNGAQERSARENGFQSLGYDCLVAR